MEENRRSFYDNVPEIDVANCQNINHLGGHLSCLTYDSPKGPCRNFLTDSNNFLWRLKSRN